MKKLACNSLKDWMKMPTATQQQLNVCCSSALIQDAFFPYVRCHIRIRTRMKKTKSNNKVCINNIHLIITIYILGLIEHFQYVTD